MDRSCIQQGKQDVSTSVQVRIGPVTLLRIFLLLVCVIPGAVAWQSPEAQQDAHGDGPLLVGYFPQWGVDSQPQYLVKDLIRSGGAGMLDQVNYSQGSVKGGHCSIASPNADLNYTFDTHNSVDGSTDDPRSTFRGNFHQLEELKKQNPRLKVLISLEGSADAFAEDAQPQNRYVFVASCVDMFLRGRFAAGVVKPGVFDGIDLDWEFPKREDAANYEALVHEFRRQMDLYRPGLRLSIAVGPGPRMYPGVDMKAVSKLADQVAVMNYDYAGPWSKTTGIIAPLYTDPADPTAPGSVDETIAAYRTAGVPGHKLLMGLPFYGYGWEQVGATNHGLYQAGQAIRSDRPYSFVQTQMAGSTLYRDQRTQAPWIFNGDTFWTFEDPTSIRFKVDYAQHQRLGGVMIWELSGDMPDASLLSAAYHQLRAPEDAEETAEPPDTLQTDE
jgi:chitinase